MRKDIQKELEYLNNKKFSTKSVSSRDNMSKNINKSQGKKNALSGHMKSIQPLGCSIGGKIGGVVTKTSGKLKENGKLGNEANQQKYGVRIIASNLLSEECWEYISIREAERDLKIQAPIIRKILRGNQPKTRCGWTFEYK